MLPGHRPEPNVIERVILTLALLGCLVGSVAGCTNAPSAIELRVSAETPQLRPNDVLHLHTQLVVKKGPVCLESSYRILAEIERLEPESLIMRQPGRWICGTGFFASLPLLPILLPMSLLDVGDGLHRFVVLKQGDERTHDLYVACERVRVDEPRLSVAGEIGDLLSARAPWPPGRYRVRVRLDNEWMSPYPAPLFWKPYDQPISADVEVTVAER